MALDKRVLVWYTEEKQSDYHPKIIGYERNSHN